MIGDIVRCAYKSAKEKSNDLENSLKSKLWIEELAKEFRLKFCSPHYRVFSSDYYENRDAFKINELLYDVSVAKIGRVDSASGKTELEFVSSCEWLVESEFHSSNSRESIIDLSKLFMGRSKNKLFVVPKSTTIAKWVLSDLTNIFPQDGSEYFVALVPHPVDWFKTEDAPIVYSLKAGCWAEV
ncbi:hypothetical protein [Shewanella decolorationis]|uniref:Uncharacterized protein n=1 Tax=Shewanella decolorationis S12 TaxID=1353536 RepID=A0ABN0PSA9_9GAMM|nr:hypothetical protein [Shewanella decolorationis]ESE43076.1 hypothetical protein SHD_0316 [Shewanella decolorationis S12]GLR32356.1 hypothetical protein GCM10007922_19130 [Shewanella decolorationis]